MQLVFLALLALSGGELQARNDPETIATVDVAHQHMAVNVLSAMYYCENKSWPSGISAIQAFHEKSKFPLPVEPNWAMLGSEGSYTVDNETLTFVTKSDAIPKAHSITSTNKPPGCADNNLEVHAHLHID